MLVALVRSVGLSAIGVALPWNLLAPLGMAQISAVLAGKRMSKSTPTPAQTAVGTVPRVAETRCKPCRRNPFPADRPEGPEPVRRREPAASIRLHVRPRNFRQRTVAVLY